MAIPKSKQDKIDHIKKCEFHKGVKNGVCPWVTVAEANQLREEAGGQRQ